MKTSTDFVPVTHVECKEKVSEVKQKMQWMTSKLGLFFFKKYSFPLNYDDNCAAFNDQPFNMAKLSGGLTNL